jgi:hypothetical protein
VELERLGALIEPELQAALLRRPSLETARRVEHLLEKVAGHGWVPAELHRLRIISLLEIMGTSAARETLEELARGAPDNRTTRSAKAALERLKKRSDTPQKRVDVDTTVWVADIDRYLKDPLAPRRAGKFKFYATRLNWDQGGNGVLEARYKVIFNDFDTEYLLRAKIPGKSRGKKTLDVQELTDVEIEYTDLLREVAGFGDKEIDQLIQQLYEIDNKVRMLGCGIPGGEWLDYSAPMRKLIAVGDKARLRLQDCLADDRIQNEVALVLGIIGDERTVPLLIQCYPGSANRHTDQRRADRKTPVPQAGKATGSDALEDVWKRNNHFRGMCLIHALGRLTGENISIYRGLSSPTPESGEQWKTWWVKAAKGFRVRQPNPHSPISPENIEAARRSFLWPASD